MPEIKSALTELLSLAVEAHRVHLEAATGTILRLSIASGRELEGRPSHAVLPRQWKPVDFRARKGRDGSSDFQLEGLTIRVGTHPFHLQVLDGDGATRFETAPAEKSGKYSDEEAGNAPFHNSEDGISLSRRMAPGEVVYGFGEIGETLNRAGNRFSLWNNDDVHHTPRQNFYCQVPFGIHLAPAHPGANQAPMVTGLFLDNPGRIEVDLGRTVPDIAQYHLETGDLVLWMIFAADLPDLLRQWTDLTGRMERPPTWALGYHQCRYSYYPEKRVRQVAREFRRRKIPCDVLYLDIHYMDEFRPFTWDAKRFPNPAKLLQELRADGFHTVTIVDPGIKVDEEDPTFVDFRKREGFFCPAPEDDSEWEDQRRRVRSGQAPCLTSEVVEEHRTPSQPAQQKSDKYFTGTVWPGAVHFPDFFRPDVRRLWGKHQKRVLLDAGIAGIWNDMNEPAVFDTPTKTFPDAVQHEEFGTMRPHSQVHQVYGLNMARASHEGFRSALPDARPFIITRSGWAGVQRYAMVWTGDNHSSWASMTLDIQMNLNMGLTGIAMVGCDIGGFLYDGLPELFARWMEWGVFQPFCRTHTAIDTLDQEPWSFGPEVEQICREMIGLRMRLLPYLSTLFAEAGTDGAPVKRPLVWHYPQDPETHNLADEFLLGRDLLVAPILTAATIQRAVYFPEGEWVHFFTGARVRGGSRMLVDAPLGQPAVYARAGAILPMHDAARQHTGEPTPGETVLLVYPAPEMEGRLVEDDGNSRGYLKGVQVVHEFTGEANDDGLKLRIGAAKGRFTSLTREWVIRLIGADYASSQLRVTANGRAVKATLLKGASEIRIPATGKHIEIVVSK